MTEPPFAKVRQECLRTNRDLWYPERRQGASRNVVRQRYACLGRLTLVSVPLSLSKSTLNKVVSGARLFRSRSWCLYRKPDAWRSKASAPKQQLKLCRLIATRLAGALLPGLLATQRQDCPRCRRRVCHPDWPQEPKQLEKAWANRQAKRREVSEVRDFFIVDEKFQAEAGRGDDFGAFT